MTGFFGEGAAGGWGDTSDSDGVFGDESAPNGDLGDGHFIRINEDAWRALLHHPQVVAALQQRAQDIADFANGTIGMDQRAIERLTEQDPGDPYQVSVQNDPNTARARAKVKPKTELGKLDEAHNSTLLKALLVHPSDPIPEGAALPKDSAREPESGGEE